MRKQSRPRTCLTPSNDGNLIRIPFPALTEERRKEQVKEVKKHAEDARIAIRNSRRDQNEVVKKAEKAKEISEDESKKFQGEIQTVTDKFIKQVDEVMSAKENELTPSNMTTPTRFKINHGHHNGWKWKMGK